jgi:DNA-binding CsgD family transcriptional regulator
MMNDSRHLLSAGLFAESLRTAGSGRFASALLAALNTAIAVDHCTVVRVCCGRASMVGTASRHSQDLPVAPLDEYVAGYGRLAPLVRELASSSARQRNGADARSVVVDPASHVECVDRFFARPAIIDTLSIAMPVNDTISFLSLYRTARIGPFKSHDKILIASVGEFLATLAEMHIRLLSVPAPPPEFLHKWHHALSGRERSVAMLLGRGETVNAVATTLELSPTTVTTYKKRAFTKLGITRQSELVALTVLLR